MVTKYYPRGNISKTTYPEKDLESGYGELDPIRLCRVILLQFTVKAIFIEGVLHTKWLSTCK